MRSSAQRLDARAPYAKGEISFGLLERIDPARVETECSHAKTLLDRLRTL